MKNIRFGEHVLPHLVAVVVFLVVTVFFFNPLFFDNKTLQQHDIQQFTGGAKEIIDYRAQTGKEALWTNRMFGGMPAYLISVQWSNRPVSILKSVLTLGLQHPIGNIFAAFIAYYILLLAFSVRPYLAIAGALAFGLSSYMIIGLGAGHNARIGAIAFMPLVVAGIHLVFSNRRWLGLGVTTAGLAMHLRENHLQITYYLLLLVVGYGIMQLVIAIKEKSIGSFVKNVLMLLPCAVLAAGTVIGQLWAVQEYSAFSIRGKSELQSPTQSASNTSALSKTYAFEYSNGIGEPLTLLVPNIYGGSSSNYLFMDQDSRTYKALMNSGNEQMANQLARYSSAYWGPQSNTAPYYAGAIICFLCVIGIILADRRYVAWLVPIGMLGIMMSWGSSFESFNYFLFDYLPAYNKFRSVTFALLLTLFAMPLLGLLGLEKLLSMKWIDVRKKIMWPVAGLVGVLLLLALTGGFGSFLREGEAQLPEWFVTALQKDRASLVKSDAWRSFWFIVIIAGLLWARLQGYLKEVAVFIALSLLMVIDLAGVSSRFLAKESYLRKRDNSFFAATEADNEILKDKSYYRVYNLQGPFNEARTSYYHQSVGGYHGVKMRRYQDLYDSCLQQETNRMIGDLQKGSPDFGSYGILNMLNVKYITYGAQRDNVIPNPSPNGAAWFVTAIEPVSSPTEELQKVAGISTRDVAVIDKSKFQIPTIEKDSTASIRLTDHSPSKLTYQSQSATNGLAVFSEIYYPKGWSATIDGKEIPIIRANYVLRALEVPAGNHTIVFEFKPAPYYTGNTIMMASSWIVLLVLLGAIAMEWRSKNSHVSSH
jgi:hypothetical protein